MAIRLKYAGYNIDQDKVTTARKYLADIRQTRLLSAFSVF